MKQIKINDNISIGGDAPVFIVAELSANHGGDIAIAKETIKAAKEAGADAIKLQTYRADTITIASDSEPFRLNHGTLWDGQTLYELYESAYTPWEWHEELFAFAHSIGLLCFSSPFDTSAIELLESLNTPLYKVASFEITDLALIEAMAQTQKPIIVSTGIATQDEISRAVNACKAVGNEQIVLLKCTSAYPAPLNEINLRTLPDLATRFDVIAGFSDHTLGITAPVAAVSLGAKMIEKHFILNRSIGGADASFSLDVEAFTQMVQAVRDTEAMLGSVSYELSQKMQASRYFARSLFVVKPIAKGERFTTENIRSIRPSHGMEPRFLPEILGKEATTDLAYATALAPEHIKGFAQEVKQ